MARTGAQVYLSYTALVLLSACQYATADLWSVHIDHDPAPSPEDGPPFSAHATRDSALLPYQIVGIVGSYVASILIIGTLLLTVGRRSRRRALEVRIDVKGTEMVKPLSTAFDPSPISPASARNLPWRSPRKLRGQKSSASSMRSARSAAASPAQASVASFDTNVIEADRQRRQDEMERLYAAVMLQEDRNSQQAQASAQEVPYSAPPEYSRRKPPRLLTDAPALRHLQPENALYPVSPRSPMTPKSPIRAIYPPDSPMPHLPMGPTSPIRAEYPTTPRTPVFPSHLNEQPLQRDRGASVGSSRTFASTSSNSNTKKIRKSLRHLKISAPIVNDDNSDGARTPLSPRFYTDPGIPPEPPTARTVDTMDSTMYPPNTPGTAASWRYGADYPSDEERIDVVRALPRAHPQRNDPNPDPPLSPQLTRIITPPRATASPNNVLPFRQNQVAASSPNTTLPFRQPDFPSHSTAHHGMMPISAGPLKTTFVESRRDRLGALRTGAATPYSPYMPFTPLTPVAARLTSRAERKQKQKEARGMQGALVEEEMVEEDADLWGDGY